MLHFKIQFATNYNILNIPAPKNIMKLVITTSTGFSGVTVLHFFKI